MMTIGIGIGHDTAQHGSNEEWREAAASTTPPRRIVCRSPRRRPIGSRRIDPRSAALIVSADRSVGDAASSDVRKATDGAAATCTQPRYARTPSYWMDTPFVSRRVTRSLWARMRNIPVHGNAEPFDLDHNGHRLVLASGDEVRLYDLDAKLTHVYHRRSQVIFFDEQLAVKRALPVDVCVPTATRWGGRVATRRPAPETWPVRGHRHSPQLNLVVRSGCPALSQSRNKSRLGYPKRERAPTTPNQGILSGARPGARDDADPATAGVARRRRGLRPSRPVGHVPTR